MLALILSAVVSAGDPVAAALQTAKEQLSRHDDVGARKTLERALTLASDKPERLGEVYLYLGLAWAEGANESRAVESFGIALKLDRTLKLPPGSAPKVQEWWKRAGGHVDAPSPPPLEAPPPVEAPPPAVVAAPPVAPVGVDEAPARKRRWWLLPAGAAVAAGVVCGVLWQQSESRFAQLAGAPPGFTSGESVASTGKALQASGWAALSIGAALAVVSLVVLLLG